MPAQTNDKDNMYVRISKVNVKASLSFIVMYLKSMTFEPLEFSFSIRILLNNTKTKNAGNLLINFCNACNYIACLDCLFSYFY